MNPTLWQTKNRGNLNEDGTPLARYRYDAQGRRIAKTVTEGGQSKTAFYLYGEEGLIAELDEGGRTTKAYGWMPGTLWGTAPLWQAEPESGKTLADAGTMYHFLHTDHLGTPVLATDAKGQKTWKGRAEAFGKTAAAGESTVMVNLRFPGQVFDEETGLHYNFFRDYDPLLGRYVQADPIGLWGGVNTYAYADGSPMTKTDSLGLATYICTRPLGGKPGSWAPPVLNHTYVCVGSGPGNMACGSTTASTQGILPNVMGGSPGAPTTPDKDYYSPDACDKRWNEDKCIETCIARELEKPSRPWYGIGPSGTDCQEYTWDVVYTCERRCARR